MPVNDKNRGLPSANRRSDACMATVQESIEVNVPLSQAYNQWTQFEEFPHFMSGVESVISWTTPLCISRPASVGPA